MVEMLPVAQAFGRLDARFDPKGGAHQRLGHGGHAEGLLVALHDLPQR